MLIHIMRHGVAVERGHPDYPEDFQRPLTPDGSKRTRAVARGLRALDTQIDAILTSPLVRARQTADIVAAEFNIDATKLRETPALEPGATPPDLYRELSKEDMSASVLLVGHEPDLSALVSVLTAGAAHAIDVPLKKAGVCLVEVRSIPPTERATLRFVMPPSALRKLGRRD